MSIPLPVALLHNVTQEAEVLNLLHDFSAMTVAPVTLLEGFLFGILLSLGQSDGTDTDDRCMHRQHITGHVPALVSLIRSQVGALVSRA